MIELTPFQKDLLDVLQSGIAICLRPYEQMGRQLDVSESTVLDEIAVLKQEGMIRRLRGQINYRTLGRVATLVAAEVPEEKLEVVVRAVNGLTGVSHNYLRDNRYNLWFTLQAESVEQIEKILSQLAAQSGIVFHSLPAERVFKLDVRFALGLSKESCVRPPDAELAKGPVTLSDTEQRALAFVQREFPLVQRPFSKAQGLDETACLNAVRSLHEKNVLKRIAAVANHYKLGYEANAMFCGQVSNEQAEQAGRLLAGYKQVSHCYLRRPFPGWPYNLFAMIHAHTDRLLKTWAADFAHTLHIREYVLLRTVRELKKEPVIL